MARYYADIQGNRGEATRMGTPNSGIRGHVRGWNIGAQVDCDPTPGLEEYDTVEVRGTHGSGGFGSSFPLATLTESPEGIHVTVHTPDGPVTWVRDR